MANGITKSHHAKCPRLTSLLIYTALALTADGIKVVGYKYAEGAEPISDDQPGIGPHMPRRK